MKKLVLSMLTLFMLSITVNAQSDTEELDFFQSVFGMEKKAVVSEFIAPSDATADAFWSIYDSYELERKALGKNRVEVLKNYVDSYGKTSDEQVDAIMTQILSLTNDNNKLIQKYYKKMKKSVSSVEAAEFYQVETYILSQIRVTILESIPFFGELE